MAGGGWIRAVRVEADEENSSVYPFSIPAVAALRAELALDAVVTFLVDENGSGKSTLVEAIAAAAARAAESAKLTGTRPRAGISSCAPNTLQ